MPCPLSPTIGLPPPDAEACLTTSRVSRFRGGTLVDEDVRDLATHQRRLDDADGYRPARCERCGHGVLHVHGYPERHPRGELAMPAVVQIVQYICAADDCNATWRVLPMFLARCLWRAWRTVERAVAPASGPPVLRIPERTVRRWRARLAATARVLVVLVAASGGAVLEAVAARIGLDGARSELVAAHTELTGAVIGERLAAAAAMAHRLERGMRLM